MVFPVEAEEKEMSLSLINCLLFIRGVSWGRFTMNAITVSFENISPRPY